jgi:hypothetical protein
MNVNTTGSADPDVVELAAAVRNLASRVECLEGQRSPPIETVPVNEHRLSSATFAVKAGTAQIFPGEVFIDPRQDPEIEDRYFVVRVSAAGAIEEIAKRYQEWHRRLGQWAPGLESNFRLSVDVNDEE